MVWLRLVHILAGVFWVGAVVFVAAFLLPAARRAGPDGRRFLGGLMRRTGPVFGIAMLLTVISGLVMYGRLSAGFNRAWVTSRPGLALATGALAAVLAAVVGSAVDRPVRVRIAALSQSVEGQGGVPTPEQARELAALQGRIERGAWIVAALLVIAAGAMAVARYL